MGYIGIMIPVAFLIFTIAGTETSEPFSYTPFPPSQFKEVDDEAEPVPMVTDERGAVGDDDMYDAEGFSLLHRAAMSGRTAQAGKLIREGEPLDIGHKKHRGTPLQYAATGGDTEMMGLLITSGASVNIKDANGRTPLIWAAMKGHADAVKILLESGADANITYGANWNALKLARKNGHMDVVAMLESHADKHDTKQ